MGFKTPEDELDQFLATKPSWLRKILEFDLPLSDAEKLAWNKSDWWQEGSKDEKEYIGSSAGFRLGGANTVAEECRAQ